MFKINYLCYFLIFIATGKPQFQSRDMAYDDLQLDERPMPKELLSDIKNKTDYELDMEDCMIEFGNCMTTQINRLENPEVCGEADGTSKHKTFENLCQMIYESCKGSTHWHYLSDGLCTIIESGGEVQNITSTTTTQPITEALENSH